MNEAQSSDSANDLRVLVVADDHLVRAGLAVLMEGQQGLTVAGQVAPNELVSTGPEVYRADLALWDLGWAPDRTLDFLAEAQDGALPAVVLLSDETMAPRVWHAGVRGLLHREVDGDVLAGALTTVNSGLAVLDPQFAVTLTDARGERAPAPAAGLTPREMEVLQLIAEGLPNKAIAGRLGVSEHTIKFHVNSILGKLGAQSRTEAVTIATRAGLLAL